MSFRSALHPETSGSTRWFTSWSFLQSRLAETAKSIRAIQTQSDGFRKNTFHRPGNTEGSFYNDDPKAVQVYFAGGEEIIEIPFEDFASHLSSVKLDPDNATFAQVERVILKGVFYE